MVERLRIHGSNTLGARLVPAMVEAWLHDIGYRGTHRTERNERIEIRGMRDGLPLIVEIERNGSVAGFQDLVDGNAEIAMMPREPGAAERDAAWQLGDLSSPDQEFVVALDGLAVVVNERNSVRRISVSQLREVLAGGVTDWSQLGGRAGAIRIHVGAVGGTRDFLRTRVMAGGALASTARTHATLAQAAHAASQDVAALAVVGVSTGIPGNTRTLAIADGGMAVLPTRLNVMSEDYPLVQRYRLYGGPLMSALGRSFAQYSITRRAQQAIEQAGFMAMILRPVTQPAPPDPAKSYGKTVAGTQRLAVSLRFNPASLTNVFESRSANDLDRLVTYLRLPENHGRQVIVVGFAHDDGSNRLITTVRSNERSDLVAEYLIKQGVPVQRSIGMGASRGLASGTSVDARYRNERVEIWLK